MALLLSLGFTLGCRTAARPVQAGLELQPIFGAQLRQVVRSQAAPMTLVNVWATWCAPCIEELPDLIRVGERYAARGLQLTFVSVDPPASRAEVGVYLAQQGVRGPAYIKDGPDQAFIEALDPGWQGVLPATALFNAAGEQIAFWEGPVNYDTLCEVLEMVPWPP